MVAPTLRYVALGDSFTIGTSVEEPERWPNQLVQRLAGEPPMLELVANLAVNGATSGDVIRDQLHRLRELEPGFASLLIGVNDVVQNVPPATYRRNVATILDALLAIMPVDRIVTVATPDYTVTPAGADYGDPVVKAAAIRTFNDVLADASGGRGLPHVDIYDLSLRAAHDRSLVADDGLHPGGAQYALWVDRIAPVVAAMLATIPRSGRPPRRAWHRPSG